MKKRLSLEEHLAAAPKRIRSAMLENRSQLEPGAGAVLGRFFQAMKERRDPLDLPTEGSFCQAARSESTLATLLRTLAIYAPDVSTVSARSLRKGYYKARNKAVQDPAEMMAADDDKAASWPKSWQALYPSLMAAKIKGSSKKRYIASICRCADIVTSENLRVNLDFYTAYCVSEALKVKNVRLVTIAGYLDGLIALGREGGADPEGLDGMRYMRASLIGEASLGAKLKYDRIASLMKKGGFKYVAKRVGKLRKKAAGLSAHEAGFELLLQTAALCAVHINKPARTGDAARWVIGSDLTRTIDGAWHLDYDQQKTGGDTSAGALWPEVCEILDDLILAGRPSRMIHIRYKELNGKNWLTLSDRVPPAKWPSERIKDAIGVPSHDLRTLAADYLRRSGPDTAANVIAAHLGHKSQQAGREYRAACEGDAAARHWAEMRSMIVKGKMKSFP